MHARPVSVVIPAYNATRYLGEALRSVLAQTVQPLEIVVVNDASPDGTGEFVREFARTCPLVREVRHEVNQGLGGTRNTGLREARGEFIAWLDHDDLWEPGHLASCLEALEGRGADLAFSTARMFEDGTHRALGDLGPAADELRDVPLGLYQRCFLTPSAVVMRRDLRERVGFFDTDPALHYCEDYDYWLRVLEAGGRMVHVEGRSCLYRKLHASAATGNLLMIMERMAWVCRKHFAWQAVPRGVRRRRTGGIHAAIGRLTVFSDPPKSRRYYLRAYRFQPLRLDYLLWAAAGFFQPVLRASRVLWRGGRGQNPINPPCNPADPASPSHVCHRPR